MAETKNPNVDAADQHAPIDGGSKKQKPPAPKTDLLDLSRLRLSQDFIAEVGVKRVLLTVPLKKPDRFQFVRVHPEWEFTTLLLNLKDERQRESYVVDPSLRDHLTSETSPVMLVPTITKQASVMMWPLRLPREDGRHDEWSRTALEAANEAKRSWVRVVANMQLGGYEILRAVGNWPEPEWPDLPFEELLRLALRDRLINTPDHPVLRQLRGEF